MNKAELQHLRERQRLGYRFPDYIYSAAFAQFRQSLYQEMADRAHEQSKMQLSHDTQKEKA